MIASTHLAAGAAAGVLSYRFVFKSDSVYGIIGALIAGIVSHFLLDMIPHADEELYRPNGLSNFLPLILSAELTFSFLAIYWCGVSWPNLNYQNRYLVAGMIGGALPDVPHVLMGALKIDWKILRWADSINVYFHTSLHPASFWQGFLPEIFFLVISLTILCFFKYEALKNANPHINL